MAYLKIGVGEGRRLVSPATTTAFASGTTSYAVTSIPSGAIYLSVIFYDAIISDDDIFKLNLRDGSGSVTSGYTSPHGYNYNDSYYMQSLPDTTGVLLAGRSSSLAFSGIYECWKMSKTDDRWFINARSYSTSGGNSGWGGCEVDLASDLTGFDFTSKTTKTFTSQGGFNYIYS